MSDANAAWSFLSRTRSVAFVVGPEDAEQDFSGEGGFLDATKKVEELPYQQESLTAKRVGNYQIQGEIGSGGMGVVYKAWHSDLERSVVVKLLRSHRLVSQSAIDQFREEVKSLGQLVHPSIVHAYDGGLFDGQPYLAMEFIEGQTLQEYVGERGPLSEADAVRIFRHVVDGMVRVAELGLIHRDVKPSNIMVLKDGSAKIFDFGLAMSSTNSTRGGVGGSIPYMAPEQALGKVLDSRADVYGLAASLFFALTGRSPLTCELDDKRAALDAAANNPRPSIRSSNTRVSRRLARYVDEALSLAAGDRPSMSQFAEQLHCGHGFKIKLGALAAALCLLVVAIISMLPPSNESATTVSLFHEEFQDGLGKEWITQDETGSGVIETVNNELWLWTRDSVKNKDDAISAGILGSDEGRYADGVFSMKVKLNSVNTGAGGVFRWDRDTKSGYAFQILRGPEGKLELSLSHVKNNDVKQVWRPRTYLDFDKTYRLRAVFEGNSIDVTVWPNGEKMPSPQIEAEDAGFSNGIVAIYAIHTPFMNDLGKISAVFDDVYFEVEANTATN